MEQQISNVLYVFSLFYVAFMFLGFFILSHK